jgi:hypothetical protein
MVVGWATRERVRMEPTSEVSSLHSMKLGGVWVSGCILDLRYHIAVKLRQLFAGSQIADTGSIVKETFFAKSACPSPASA